MDKDNQTETMEIVLRKTARNFMPRDAELVSGPTLKDNIAQATFKWKGEGSAFAMTVAKPWNVTTLVLVKDGE